MSLNNFSTDGETQTTKLAMERNEITGENSPAKEMEKAKEMFKGILNKRKLRLDVGTARTHSAPTSPAANISLLDFTWDEEEARSVKRLKEGETKDSDGEREDTDGTERLATKIRKLIKSMDKEIRVVAELARERNTKREIKEATQNLRSYMSQIMTQESQVLLQTLGKKSRMGERSSFSDGTDKDEEISKLQNTNARLEEENKKLKERIKHIQAAGGKVNVEEEMLQDTEAYDQFLLVEKLIWPNRIFRSAFPAAGSPLAANKDTDSLVLHEEGNNMEESESRGNEELEKAFGERYPELKDLEGRITAITINTKVVKEGQATGGTDRWVIRAELNLEEGSEEWFKLLVEIRNMMVDSGRIYPPSPDPEGVKTRKILEYIFRKTNIKCLLHTRTQVGGARKKRGTDALVISQPGRSYSDLLKTLKETVKPGTTSARAIKTIRESKDGRMVVILDKDGGAIEELRGEIGKMNDVNIRAMKGEMETTLFINDIDGLTTKEEVQQAICEELGLPKDLVAVGDLRKSYGGNQTTAIRLPRETAELLLGKGRTRIGLSWCPVKERVEVIRCFRCWKYGHLAKDCGEPDGSKLCRKCGGSGHVAKGCNKEEYCLTCKMAGHRTGSEGCPEFRKAIARERLKRKEKKRY